MLDVRDRAILTIRQKDRSMDKFRRSRAAFALIFSFTVGPALAAGPSPSTATEMHPKTAAEASGLRIEAAWVRATPGGAKVGAGYFRIVNATGTADRLIGISSPAAAKVELHEMSISATIARMRPVLGGLEIPAGATVTLKPGAYHLMFQSLKAPFKKGDHVEATLAFEKAGKIDVEFAVRGIGAGAP